MHPLSEILECRGLAEPDGRPLYAYRLTQIESEQIRAYLASELTPGVAAVSTETAALFCLFGADHWRKSYAGGPWSWDPILAALDAFHLSPSTAGYRLLQKLVSDGLARLKRLLLRRHQREYLLTLGCEGGLPLQMVLREATALRRYFQALFREYRMHEPQLRLSGGLRIRDLAKHVSGELPQSLREEVVFELSEQIVETVLEHAGRVPGAEDPITALDQVDPAWRDNLPLELSDNVARAFLQQLLKDAGTVPKRLIPQICFRRSIKRGRPLSEAEGDSSSGATDLMGNGRTRYEWTLMGTLEFPVRVAPETISAIFGDQPAGVPGRFDLLLHEPPDNVLPCARARLRHDGESAQLTLTRLQRGASGSGGAYAAGTRSLILQASDGTRLISSDFPGALALSDLPWVFAARADEEVQVFEYRGEGTVSVHTQSMIVAADPSMSLQPAGPADVLVDLGMLAGDQPRRVWEIRGVVEVCARDGERYRLRTAIQDAAFVGAHYLTGRKPDMPLPSEMMFAGFPKLCEERPDGYAITVPDREVEWRSVLPSARWTSDLKSAVGAGWIRRRISGATVFRTNATILPSAMHVSVAAGPGDRGTIDVEGAEAVDIRVEPDVGYAVSVASGERGTRIVIEKQGVPRERLTVHCIWPLRGEARFDVPTPLEHVRFEDVRGRPSVAALRIASAQLPYMRATAMSPKMDPRFYVVIDLNPGSTSEVAFQAVPPRQERDLVPVAGGGYELHLGSVQPHVDLLLSSTTELDATVKLTIRADPPLTGKPVELSVTRYDVAFDFNASDCLRLEASDTERLAIDELKRLDCRAIPLLAPAEEPIPLTRVADDTWQIDDQRMSPGPWLVSAWDGLWCRVRPRLHVVPVVASKMTTSALAEAMLEPDWKSRRNAIAFTIGKMADDPTDAGWDLIDQMLQRCEEFPSPSFDAIVSLALIDKALAMSALCMAERGPEALDRLFKATESLPMHWATITVHTWQSVMDRWLGRQQEVLAQGRFSDADSVAICREVTDCIVDMQRLPWLSPLLDRGYFAVFNRQLGNDTMALFERPFLKKQAQQIYDCVRKLPIEPRPSPSILRANNITDLRQKLGDRLRNPQPLGVERVREYQDQRNYELVNAPLLVAISAVCNIESTWSIRHEVRAIENMYPAWFTQLYTAAFHYGVAALFQEIWKDGSVTTSH